MFYWHNSMGTLDYTEAFDGDKTNAGYQITEGSGKAEVNIYKISGRYLEIEIGSEDILSQLSSLMGQHQTENIKA